jgi:predicted Zn-dependent protease
VECWRRLTLRRERVQHGSVVHGGIGTRGCALLATALLGGLTAFGPTASAEKKKPPGMFDFQTWRTPEGYQREDAKQLAPGELDLTPAESVDGALRTLRIRIYADRDYRHIVLGWKRIIRAQIDRVNRVIEPIFGVRFEIESLRDWDQSHGGASFEPIMTELEAMDAGSDVDWVLGLVTPFRGVATSVHQIGSARTLSRQFVLRGMDDEQESLALDREFNLLRPEERRRVYADRKSHKETVVFLHEWGHALGALHNEDPLAIMHPTYDVKRAAFSDFEKSLMTFVIGRRLARPDQRSPESPDVVDLLQQAPSDEGTEKERASLVAFARTRGGGPPVGRKSPLDLPGDDAQKLRRAVEALNAGRVNDAWVEWEPLGKRYPKQEAVASLACALVTGHPHSGDAEIACNAAIARQPRDARLLLAAAAARVQAHDLPRATPLVLTAVPLVASDDAESWRRLASLAASVGALSTAEAALGHVKHDHPDVRKLIEEVDAQRMRIALPHDGAKWGVSVEQEPTFVTTFEDVERLIGRGSLATARVQVREFRERFPDAPATDLLTCDLELQEKHVAAAVKRCEAVLTKFGQATRALYLLGFMAARAGRTDVAEKHLRKAILLGPRDPNPWRELARIYRVTHANSRLSDLEAQHEALLSAPLTE